MSRSYKHTPIFKSHDLEKKYANRKVRRAPLEDEILPGKSARYKKFFESWDLNDQVDRETLKEAIYYYYHPYHNWGGYHSYDTLEEWLKLWYKYHYRK